MPLLAAAPLPVEASCAQSRRFTSNHTFALDDETWLVHGLFWARGDRKSVV